MDPNLFHLDWERTIEALVAIIVLAFFVERACALLFESRWYIWRFEDPRVGGKPTPPAPAGVGEAGGGEAPTPAPGATPSDRRTRLWPIKEIVAFVVAVAICLRWRFDAVSMIVLSGRTQLVGELVTAAVIAGGSKASVKLFQDLMGIRSAAALERKKLRDEGAAP